MEDRKHQFFVFSIILIIVGLLNYYRRIINGYKMTKKGKIIYISTMITFIIGIMFCLYYTELNNIVSFILGLIVANTSENIAKLFVTIGDNFNPIVVKIIKTVFKIDFSDELKDLNNEKEDSNDGLK